MALKMALRDEGNSVKHVTLMEPVSDPVRIIPHPEANTLLVVHPRDTLG
jgi:hypothetical protein